MNEGDFGWTSKYRLVVNDELEAFLDPKAEYYAYPIDYEEYADDRDYIFVERTRAGYEVTINHQTEWEREAWAEGMEITAIHENF